jgi:Fic family protein
MHPDRFKPNSSGRLIKAGQGDRSYWAFVPNPLPPELSYSDQEMMLIVAESHQAIGELAGLARSIANPQLLVQPFIRREAVTSSMIEGTNTGVAELYAYEAGHGAIIGSEDSSPEADRHEVLNYVRALEFAMERRETLPISLRFIKEIHGILMQGVRGGRAYPGEFRRTQNWIGGATINSARYVPPPVDEMNEALNAFEKYLHQPNDYPPLVRLAFVHYQFEAIHPFVDGNGRTGRLLIPLLMVHWDMLPLPMLNLSSFFERHREDYYDLLLGITLRGEWREWVLFFLEGFKHQAKEAIALTQSLHKLQNEWRAKLIQANAPLPLLQIVESLFKSPLITIPEAQQIAGVSTYNTARSYIQKLVDLDILHATKNGKSIKVYSAYQILELVAEDASIVQAE